MTQVLDMCTLIGELADITLGSSSTVNEPPQRLVELKQIYKWARQVKMDLELHITTQLNLENEHKRLKSLPQRQEILKTIDLGIQSHMKELDIDMKLGGDLLIRTMGVVESNLMILLQQIDSLLSHSSQLLLDIHWLTEKLNQYETLQHQTIEEVKNESNAVSKAQNNVTGSVTQMQKNAALNLISKLKQQKHHLNTRLAEVLQSLDTANKRIDILELQIASNTGENITNNIQIQKQQIDQLLTTQRSDINRIKSLQKQLKDAKAEITSHLEIKNQFEANMNKTNTNLKSLSLELTKEKSKRSDLQFAYVELQQKINQTPNEKSQALARQLVQVYKKMEQMMNRVANYQNKVLDLELDNEALVFQINTLKTNLEEIKTLKNKNSKLSQSGRFLQNGKVENLNRMVESLKHDSIKQFQEKQIYSPVQKYSKKSLRQRIFGDDKSKKGSQASEPSQNRIRL